VSERLPLTLCVSTRNAAAMLEGCLESCAGWVSEIVIVDMASEDATREIAARFGARIVDAPVDRFAEPARQLGIDAGTQPWMLVLDADERAPEGVRRLCERAVARDDLDGLWLPRLNHWFGRPIRHGAFWPDRKLRLFRPGKARWPPFLHTEPVVSGRVERAPADHETAIIHHTHASVKAWLRSADVYTDIEADRLAGEGERLGPKRLVGYPVGRFVEGYVVRGGFRDGSTGLAIALLSLVYELLVAVKLWERTRG
jgi:glycosyltransferase involved in cell wall biosynthesis